MNAIQEFMMKAQLRGAKAELENGAKMKELLRAAEARALKAENEAEELKAALGSMQLLKEKYQTVVLDLMAVLERHGLVS